MKKVISLILSAVMVLSITAGLNFTAFAEALTSSQKTVSDGTYRILSLVDVNMCLDVAENDNIVLNTSDAAADQLFDVEYSETTQFYTITHVASGKVLEVESDEDGANVQLAEADDSDNQKWAFEGTADGQQFYLRAAVSGYYLDLVDGTAADGQNVRIFTGNQQSAQKWVFSIYSDADTAVIADGTFNVISALNPYRCLSATNGNIELGRLNDSTEQQFTFTFNDGCYYIESVSTGEYIDLFQGMPVSGTNINLYTYNGYNNQRWIIRPAGDGYYYILSKETGLYFDVEDGAVAVGTNVRALVGNQAAAQKWKFVCVGDHTWNDGEVTEEATCITTGVITYTCTACGETKTEKIDRAEHTPATLNAVDATCTTSGLTAGSYCSVCGKVLTAQEIVPAKGHTYNSVVTEPTCSTLGYTTYTCADCDDVFVSDYVDKTEHTIVPIAAVAPTCTATGLTTGYKCSVCEKIIVAQNTVDALGHDYAAVVTAPTCTSQGYTTYTCTRCGDSYVDDYTEIIEHSWDDGVVTVKATPTATGERTYTCTACNETRTEEIAKCAKYANPIKVKAKTATVKFANLKKKNQTVAAKNALTVTKAQGKLTYAKTKGNKKITVAKNGKITVKKGLKKGTYKVKVKVKAAGNATYKAKAVTVTVTIKVK